MNEPREEWQLDTCRIGRRVLVFEALDSTNNHASSLAYEVSHDGLVILAQQQTAGRGQHGRSWHCPPGQGVMMSVLLFPPPELRRPVVLAAWAAVSVCATVEHFTRLTPRLKWPNDVLVQERKVCGILIEQGRGTVAGIGLNVNQPASVFAAAGLPEAASLASLTGASFDVCEVARKLVAELDAAYDCLVTGSPAAVERRWQPRLGLVGRTVDVVCTERTFRGQLRSLSFAEVAMELPDGKILALNPEEVRHFREV